MTRRFALLLLPLLVVACQDMPEPVGPADAGDASLGSLERSPHAPQDLAVWFARSSPEVMALPQTVFADHDQEGNRLVFGVEHEGMIRRVRNVMGALNIPASAYHVKVTEPIHVMNDLRSVHRPTVGGIQIHWSQYVCTLGFNVDHTGGRSFITNSHCTDKRGENTGTLYHQPSRTVAPDAIGVEADDPEFFRGGVCPRGRVCRYSDAARALYGSDTDSNRGEIAITTGENNHELVVAGSFTVASQDNSSTDFSGTLHKVGRTTGWTSGTVSNTCATVNVSGSNVTMLCETLVDAGQQIVAGGDSGSPVFKRKSGDNVELVGILWGGSSSGNRFVFSPLKDIQNELGGLTATADGSGGGNGNGDGDNGDDENGGGGGGNCPPGNPNHRNCQ